MLFNKWKPYDPEWLVMLAKQQFPNDTALHYSLSQCTKVLKGYYFVNPKRPNKHGSEWQFSHCITLFDPEIGEVVLDILKDGRVGSMEFVGKYFK